MGSKEYLRRIARLGGGLERGFTLRTSSTSRGGPGGAHDEEAGVIRRVFGRGTPKNLTASLLDIDISLTDIVFQRSDNGFDGLGDRRPTALVDYALEGVVDSSGIIENVDGASEPLLVYVSGYEEADRMDRFEDFDQRSICYIATDRRSDYAWRANIYIERLLFRRLVELYASRRIDFARITVLLKVLRDASGAVEVPSLNHPMLRKADDRNGRHSRAHLMSVHTSLSAVKDRPALVTRSPTWGARLGRQHALSTLL